jgi:acetyl-CoA carboxylase biotin carboxyl carrier protein
MSDMPVQDSADEVLLESLCRQARGLASSLPGPLGRVTLAVGSHRVDVEWHAPASPVIAGSVVAGPAAVGAVAASPAAALPAAVPEPVPELGQAIVAPLVGTVYLAPEPGAPPFVADGESVEAGQQVAIIEAMKLMNRVEADHAGRVVKILVADNDMVEFGQELMIIESGDAEG